MKICSVLGCNNKYYAKGYCKKHYVRFKKYGDPLYLKYDREKEKYGMCGTPEYKTYYNMKDRCFNKNYDYFHRYGGRGITICKRWRDSFIAFYEDMGPKPFPKATIDRINNNGNYEPGNCRWVTAAENCRNGSWVKLTMQKAQEIRKLYKSGGITQKAIGFIYGVTKDSISLIVNNKQWT